MSIPCLPDGVNLLVNETPNSCCTKKSYFKFNGDRSTYMCGTPDRHLFRQMDNVLDYPNYYLPESQELNALNTFDVLPCKQDGHIILGDNETCCSKIIQRVYLPDREHWYEKCDSASVNDKCIPDLHQITSPNECCSGESWLDFKTGQKFCGTQQPNIPLSILTPENNDSSMLMYGVFLILVCLIIYFFTAS